MSDDWRVRMRLPSSCEASEAAQILHAGGVEHHLDVGERVMVSVDGAELFVYAGSRAQAQRAASAISTLAGSHGWQIEQQLARWHPIAEQWDDPDEPLPEDAAAIEAERHERSEHEREESSAVGYPEWELRVECGSHRETVALAEQLSAEGVASVRRWRYLVIPAEDEESAGALAERLRAQLPAGATVTVEEQAAAVAASGPFNPFTLFGGLGR